MLTALVLFGLAVLFLAGVVIGAYSHKWLGAVTGAPSNIRSTVDAATALKTAASTAAHAAVDAAHGEAKAAIAKLV